jgi:hypothetical protein
MKKRKASTRRQMSYKQLVRKVCKDHKFAKKVHCLVCEARRGDHEAAEKLEALVALTDDDLEQCCLPSNLLEILNCGHNKVFAPLRTNTTTLLLDFAAMV